MLICITHPSWRTSSALLSVVVAWEGRSCVLIKLVRSVVFGRTILVFVFPKSLLSFWFTTSLWTAAPLPHNEVSRHCGTGVSVPEHSSYHVFVTFDEHFKGLFLHFFIPRVHNVPSVVLRGHKLSRKKKSEYIENWSFQQNHSNVWRANFLKDAVYLQLLILVKNEVYTQLLSIQECYHTSTDFLLWLLWFSKTQWLGWNWPHPASK